jgi:hypothetical protein
MTRLRGRAARGRRLHAQAPAGHWQTTTMISSIRLDGSTACMIIESATDTEVFRAYVRQVLVPTLRPGDIVILDQLHILAVSFHGRTDRRQGNGFQGHGYIRLGGAGFGREAITTAVREQAAKKAFVFDAK